MIDGGAKGQTMRLRAFAILAAFFAAFLAAGPARAADPCADIAQSVATLEAGDPFQMTAQLFVAARLGCEREARALIDRGASIDARDREGMTALSEAARAGKVKLVSLLIDKGADVNARSINGSTPLFYAAEADRVEATRVLIDHGAIGASEAKDRDDVRKSARFTLASGDLVLVEASGATEPSIKVAFEEAP